MGLSTCNRLSTVFSSISANTIFSDESINFNKVLSDLAGDASSFFGFENHLGEGDGTRDIALCFFKENFDSLTNWCDSLLIKFPTKSYWSRIRDIASNKKSSLYQYLNSLWIEIDQPKDISTEVENPGLFIELQSQKVDADFAYSKVIPILTGNSHHPSSANIKSCISLLEDMGSVAHFGYFPGRSTDKVRMTISFSNFHNITRYCSIIFGNRLTSDIIRRIEEMSKLTDYGVLHLDIGSEIVPRIGIEMRFIENEENLEYQWRWKSILSRIIDRGLCSGEEAERLLDFSGITRFMDEGSLTPSWYKYFIYYIKGVLDFRGKEHYKAYCAFSRQSTK